jgi:peptidyl-prolyl cis-trans isomerase-like protein 2
MTPVHALNQDQPANHVKPRTELPNALKSLAAHSTGKVAASLTSTAMTVFSLAVISEAKVSISSKTARSLTAGDIFEFTEIIPYLRRTGNLHPRTGAALQPTDLIRLKFHKNAQGEYFCPVMLKSFTGNSKIVTNKKSGQVFSMEAVQEMNIDKGNWFDLVTDEPFERIDLLVLQDPSQPKDASSSFINHHLEAKKIHTSPASVSINLTGGIGRVLKELKMTPVHALNQDQPANHVKPRTELPNALKSLAAHSTGKVAASLTSTAMTVETVNERAVLDEIDTLASLITANENGTACIKTNYGDLIFTIYCGKSPRCAYNFFTLARQGFYRNVSFHRLMPGFMVQGGDPSGSGRGGKSCWGEGFEEVSYHPTLSHSERGILSMANAGANTNSSQFFITFGACVHLDLKHPIFGKLINGHSVLNRIESIPCGRDTTIPLHFIVIEDVFVLEDPFIKLKEKLTLTNAKINEDQKLKEIKQSNYKLSLRLDPSSKEVKTSTPSLQIGKYLVKKATSSAK